MGRPKEGVFSDRFPRGMDIVLFWACLLVFFSDDGFLMSC